MTDGTGGELTAESACATAAATAAQVVVEEEVEVEVAVERPEPVLLYLMFDRSYSMGVFNLWTPAVEAVSAFVRDDASAGVDLAMQYFPNHAGSNTAVDCRAAQYSTPAVEAGRLPAHAATVNASLLSQNPQGEGTPIEGALRGVTEFCKAFQAKNDEACVGVLVTDGEPEYAPCEEDNTRLAAIAADAFENYGVQTFAVGLQGADFTLLDAIARQGGAVDCDPRGGRFACDVSDGPSVLTTALSQIRDTVIMTETRTETQTRTVQRALPCEWEMPKATGDMAVDPNRVNIEVRKGTAEIMTLGRVASAGRCGDRGWYYDDNDAPTRILTCPQTCELVTEKEFTDVEIILGCATRDLPLE